MEKARVESKQLSLEMDEQRKRIEQQENAKEQLVRLLRLWLSASFNPSMRVLCPTPYLYRRVLRVLKKVPKKDLHLRADGTTGVKTGVNAFKTT